MPSSRDSYLKRKYGITEADYQAMLQTQGGKCAICGRPPKPGKNLCVDHEHSKARTIRGLLCFRCNKYLIGRYRKEHAWLFTKAAEYLSA